MPNWPADAVKRWPIARLVPYARNSRVHSDAQIGQIAASIREWGWTVPILIDEQGGIIAGHARLLAALKLGLDEVPVMIAQGWSEAQVRAYVIADNKLNENAAWDDDLLRIELSDLAKDGFELETIGFSTADLNSFLGGWGYNEERIDAAGAHTDGIKTTIKVVVPQEAAGLTKDTIAAALEAAGISFEW